MKALICMLLISFAVYAETETGTSPMGPSTMGQPSYPNSGILRNRSDNVTGSGMSNSTFMSSDQDPTVPTETPSMKKQKQEEIPPGPYKDGQYQFWDKDQAEKVKP
jgi:hypothetical protein